MSIDRILSEQRKWLDEATRHVERPEAPERTLAMPANILEQRSREIDLRIERLEAQKQATISRYDAAIAAEHAEKEQLARDIDWEKDGPRTSSGSDPARKEGARAKAAARPAAKAARKTSARSAAPAKAAAKKAKSKSRKGRGR